MERAAASRTHVIEYVIASMILALVGHFFRLA
jgi:hypothetical protein